MLLDATAALLALAALIDSASIEVRLATPALASEPVLAAIERARARGVPVKVVLGATPVYSVDDRGRLSGPNRPYDKGPQGAELARLDAARADTYIPPRFNEIGPDGLQRGVQAHMAYAVIDRSSTLICTTAFSTNAPPGVCVVDRGRTATALAGLHEVDHNYRLPPEMQKRFLATLERADLVATPDMEGQLALLLKQPWTHAMVGLLGDGPVIEAWLQSPHRPSIWLARGAPHSKRAIARLRERGFDVRESAVAFDGMLLIGPSMTFLGSQRLEESQLARSRDLGILLPRGDGETALRLSQAWRGTTANLTLSSAAEGNRR